MFKESILKRIFFVILIIARGFVFYLGSCLLFNGIKLNCIYCLHNELFFYPPTKSFMIIIKIASFLAKCPSSESGKHFTGDHQTQEDFREIDNIIKNITTKL